ncbi:hypothetical protein RFI_31974 [Reticulomyxa filosa]|uniref:inositol-phosphate phosphatase n=1 Tax=Reticulomyxa filosa TaxID=46433 RepID=X6LWC2_RETFI|nr:hypothetical protein RFI_31974 [Reticulomyxa filosa]|eukprot:ETO05422.1 hypothetical protein RFI_31974 [Reticulomyxa filosa]
MRLPQHRQEEKPFLHDKLRDLKSLLDGNKDSDPRGVGKTRVLPWLVLSATLLSLFACVSFVSRRWDSDGEQYGKSDLHLDLTLRNLVSVSIGLSQLAGERIRKVKQSHKEGVEIKGQTNEGVDEPVTVADKVSNSVFINGFKSIFGNDMQLVSEETQPKTEAIIPQLEFVDTFVGGDRILNKQDISIIVDPLDATKEFTEETDVDGSNMLPFVTTLVCIVEKAQPIAGIIYRPFASNEPVIWGIATPHARHVYPNIAKIATGDSAHLIAVSRSHTGDAKDIVRDVISDPSHSYRSLPVGGSGYKSWLVLTGQADAYIHVTKIKIWDLCAGHALLRAAGGDVTDKRGNPLLYKSDQPEFNNGLVAALHRNKIDAIVNKLSS